MCQLRVLSYCYLSVCGATLRFYNSLVLTLLPCQRTSAFERDAVTVDPVEVNAEQSRKAKGKTLILLDAVLLYSQIVLI